MQNNPTSPADRLSIGKASEYLGVSIDTLRRWEKKGRITPLRSPGGHRYFSKEELDKLFGKKYVRDSIPSEPVPKIKEDSNLPDTSFAIPTPDTPVSISPSEAKPAPPPILDENVQSPQETETKEILIPPIKLLKIQGSSIPTQHAQTTTDKPLQSTKKAPVLSNNQKTMLEDIISEKVRSKKNIPALKIVVIGMILFAIVDLIIAYILFSSSSMISPIP